MRSTASSSSIAAAEVSRGTGLRPFPAFGAKPLSDVEDTPRQIVKQVRFEPPP